MWVLTGERERSCGIHNSGKVNQIADEGAGGGTLLEPVDSPPVVIGVTGTAAIMRCLLLHDSKACIRVSQADRLAHGASAVSGAMSPAPRKCDLAFSDR
jgi:hypothetical protein